MEEPKDQMEAGCSAVVCFLLGFGVTIERNTVEVQCRSRGCPASLLWEQQCGVMWV